MIISIVVAMAENRVIGKDNQLPWDLPNDMKHFREVTNGLPIIMGRKTHESIGRPLPNRRNIVITRTTDATFDGCDTVHSLEEAIDLAATDEPEEVCIIGGSQIYERALPLATRIHLTVVHGDVEGDATFPVFEDDSWEEVGRERHEADEQHAYAYSFVTYDRM